MALAPGERLVIDERVESHPYFRSNDTASIGLDVWFVATDDPGRLVQRSAPLGRATAFRDGRVRLDATVPTVVAERSAKFGPAVAQPTMKGDYRIEGIDGFSLVVQVTADAPPVVLPASPPAPVDPARQVLGEHDLAGVEFGTRDDDADDRLVARFGPPTGRKDWQDGCIGQYRWAWWGSLVVEFRREDPNGDGRLATYRYGSPDWWFDGADADVASVSGLATRHGIVLGTTVAELRSIDENGVFHTDYSGFSAQRWNVPGTEIVATLDRDFLVAGASVARISAPREAAMTVC